MIFKNLYIIRSLSLTRTQEYLNVLYLLSKRHGSNFSKKSLLNILYDLKAKRTEIICLFQTLDSFFAEWYSPIVTETGIKARAWDNFEGDLSIL